MSTQDLLICFAFSGSETNPSIDFHTEYCHPYLVDLSSTM